MIPRETYRFISENTESRRNESGFSNEDIREAYGEALGEEPWPDRNTPSDDDCFWDW